MIERHNSWDIIDSTKINTYLDCPRKYFYEYILGWRPASPNVHLEFGKALHVGMEHLLLSHDKEGRYTEQAVGEAWELFLSVYRESFPPEFDEINSPKDPSNALRALAQYTQVYKDDKFKTLYTEIAGTIPLHDERRLHFRMDSILETPDGIKSREHKTGSTLSRQWTDQWSMSIQVGTYNHVLYCLFPQDEVWGVEINGIFLQKKENKFQRVPARRSIPMMNVWLSLVSDIVEDIIDNTNRLSLSEEDDDTLPVFRQNPQSCTKYFGCPYLDLCMSWPNPLRNIDRIPGNMQVVYWNPSVEEHSAKNVFHIPE